MGWEWDRKNKIGSREEWLAGGLEGWKWRGKGPRRRKMRAR